MGLIEYESMARLGKTQATTETTLPIVEESAASGDVALVYEQFRTHFGRPQVPGILKCFATHPPMVRHMLELSQSLIFADGHLDRRQKEMIGTFVSAENQCAYCADSHGYFFRVYGGSAEAGRAIAANQIASPSLSNAEQALLAFVQKVNRVSHDITKDDVAILAGAGWSELQIAEAVHVAALFATFNRVVNAFGLQSQGLLALYEDTAIRG